MKLGVYIMILEATYTLYTKNPTDRRYIAWISDDVVK
jgi:hypothetical protein